MASYQVRQRDPLLDQGTQAMLEKRGRELLGLFLVVVAVAFVLMLGLIGMGKLLPAVVESQRLPPRDQ